MDITIPKWIVDVVLWVVGLLTKDEWRIMFIGVGYTFATTYFINAFRKAFVPAKYATPAVIRIIALTAGMLAARTIWPTGDVARLNWYEGGVLLGPLSIAVHHFLLGIASTPPVNSFAPWLYPLILGIKDPRKDKAKRKGYVKQNDNSAS